MHVVELLGELVLLELLDDAEARPAEDVAQQLRRPRDGADQSEVMMRSRDVVWTNHSSPVLLVPLHLAAARHVLLHHDVAAWGME